MDRENAIRQALADIAADASNDDFYVQYQPIVDLKTDAVCGFEALARLRMKSLGPISPVEFIPIAEKTKLIIPIGEKVMISTLRFLRGLAEQGIHDIVISVNISAIELLQPDFAGRLLGLIGSMRVDPACVGIEITESVFSSDYEEINRIILRLREAGIHHVLRALLCLANARFPFDPRMNEALDLLKDQFRRGYLLRGSAYSGLVHFPMETGRMGLMNTLRCLRVLRQYDPQLCARLLEQPLPAAVGPAIRK